MLEIVSSPREDANGGFLPEITWFHLPDAPEFRPGEWRKSDLVIELTSYIYIPPGHTVSFHGIEGTFRVLNSHLHLGQPDEGDGLHVFLEAEPKRKSMKPNSSREQHYRKLAKDAKAHK